MYILDAAQNLGNEIDAAIDARKYDLKKLLAALGGVGEVHDFRTFDDSPAERKHLTRKLRGTQEEVWSELDSLNRMGAGVFVMVNETDGRQPLLLGRIAARFGVTRELAAAALAYAGWQESRIGAGSWWSAPVKSTTKEQQP